MPRRIAIKDHVQEIQLISQRAITMLVIMIILIALLITRLAYLQLVNHDLYTTLSKKNWLDLVPIEPTRGLIFDRNGVMLAENIPIFSLDVIPNKVKKLPTTLAEIGKIVPLSDNDLAQFQRQLKQHRQFDEVTLKLRLTEEESARFAEQQYRFPGVFIKARLMRHYPFGTSFSHMLGYVARINIDELKDIDASNYSATNYIGKLGIEKFYEDELHGTVGYEQVENDARGEPVRMMSRIKPIPGKNLYLTIDSKLQIAAEQALSGHRGAIVAIQPSTGQILALVSEPSYDPNLFVEGITSKDYKALQQSEDRPLYNRALRGLYPFASTIKPFLALEGLDSGAISTNYSIFDPGWYQLPTNSHKFHDWRRHGHGTVNVMRAIMVSCDTFFYDLSRRLGIQRINYILHQFGFGDLTGIDMYEELPGNVASPAWKRKVKKEAWYEGDTIISGIGQGSMQTTPLQLAQGVATLANRGIHYTPHLLQAFQEPGKKLDVQAPQPLAPIKLNNPNNWNIIINAMEQVLTSPNGTGYIHFGKLGPYTAAAKTGTAQVVAKKHYDNEDDHNDQRNLPERFRDHSWLMIFAPVENPKIALAIIVENSNQASNIARKVLDYYLLGIPVVPDTEEEDGDHVIQ